MNICVSEILLQKDFELTGLQFELRLKSDLALWTRAQVNITLANLTSVQFYPDKSKFALEALRLARELKADDSMQNAVWTASNDELESLASELLLEARVEEAELEKSWSEAAMKEEEQTKGEEGKQQRRGKQVFSTLESDEESLDFDQKEKEPMSSKNWQIEGSFSVGPVTELDKFPCETDDEDESDDGLIQLPVRAVLTKSRSRLREGLLTPAPSSDVEMDENLK